MESLVEVDLKCEVRTDKNTTHSYLELYNELLSGLRETDGNILEIGVFYGGSISLWHGYFHNATIYGCDITDKFLNQHNKYRENKSVFNDRVKLLLNKDAYTSDYVKKNFIDKNIKFDFLIDDGPHNLRSQVRFIQLYSPLLTSDGILIIEDVQNITWLENLKQCTPNHLKRYIKCYDLRNTKGRYDDIVFTINKNN